MPFGMLSVMMLCVSSPKRQTIRKNMKQPPNKKLQDKTQSRMQDQDKWNSNQHQKRRIQSFRKQYKELWWRPVPWRRGAETRDDARGEHYSPTLAPCQHPRNAKMRNGAAEKYRKEERWKGKKWKKVKKAKHKKRKGENKDKRRVMSIMYITHLKAVYTDSNEEREAGRLDCFWMRADLVYVLKVKEEDNEICKHVCSVCHQAMFHNE